MKLFILLSLLLLAVCQDQDVCLCTYRTTEDVPWYILDVCSSFRPESATDILYCKCTVEGQVSDGAPTFHKKGQIYCFGEHTGYQEEPVEGDNDDLSIDFTVGLKCTGQIGGRFCFHCNVHSELVKNACEEKGYKNCATIYSESCQ